MFGTPVRVHPLFWLVSLILGYDTSIQLGVGYLLAWVACVFVSILLHEFGHVWMGRLFGSQGYIVLYSFGGLAVGSNRVPYAWQRILVLLAGPGIQLLLFAFIRWKGVWLLSLAPPAWQDALAFVLDILIWINLFWPLLNLLPIWPLDGGQIMREVCLTLLPARGVAISLGISMVVSGVLAIHLLMAANGRPLIPGLPAFGGMLMALFFAMFCVSSYTALHAENERHRQWEHDEWI
jgi:Zn-dependent protease